MKHDKYAIFAGKAGKEKGGWYDYVMSTDSPGLIYDSVRIDFENNRQVKDWYQCVNLETKEIVWAFAHNENEALLTTNEHNFEYLEVEDYGC